MPLVEEHRVNPIIYGLSEFAEGYRREMRRKKEVESQAAAANRAQTYAGIFGGLSSLGQGAFSGLKTKQLHEWDVEAAGIEEASAKAADERDLANEIASYANQIDLSSFGGTTKQIDEAAGRAEMDPTEYRRMLMRQGYGRFGWEGEERERRRTPAGVAPANQPIRGPSVGGGQGGITEGQQASMLRGSEYEGLLGGGDVGTDRELALMGAGTAKSRELAPRIASVAQMAGVQPSYTDEQADQIGQLIGVRNWITQTDKYKPIEKVAALAEIDHRIAEITPTWRREKKAPFTIQGLQQQGLVQQHGSNILAVEPTKDGYDFKVLELKPGPLDITMDTFNAEVDREYQARLREDTPNLDMDDIHNTVLKRLTKAADAIRGAQPSPQQGGQQRPQQGRKEPGDEGTSPLDTAKNPGTLTREQIQRMTPDAYEKLDAKQRVEWEQYQELRGLMADYVYLTKVLSQEPLPDDVLRNYDATVARWERTYEAIAKSPMLPMIDPKELEAISTAGTPTTAPAKPKPLPKAPAAPAQPAQKPPKVTAPARQPSPRPAPKKQPQQASKYNTTLDTGEEKGFQAWYANAAKQMGINRDPDDPRHHYDYRSAFKAGVAPKKGEHWPSQFKHPDHPHRIVKINGNWVDTKTGNSAYGIPTEELRAILKNIEQEFPKETRSDEYKEIASRIRLILKTRNMQLER